MSNITLHVENGELGYPCRCGQTHSGPYAMYDYGHHNCFHDVPLVRLAADACEGAENMLICPACGKSFHVEGS